MSRGELGDQQKERTLETRIAFVASIMIFLLIIVMWSLPLKGGRDLD